MRYNNTLKLYLFAPVAIPVRISLNTGGTQIVTVHDLDVFHVDLSRKKAHIVSIEQMDNPYDKFIHIEKIGLGNLNITPLMHNEHVCSVILKNNNIKIAHFVDTIGKPDIMKINIDVLIYQLLIKNFHCVSAL